MGAKWKTAERRDFIQHDRRRFLISEQIRRTWFGASCRESSVPLTKNLKVEKCSQSGIRPRPSRRHDLFLLYISVLR